MEQKSSTRCKACDTRFSPRIIGDEEEDMCSKCINYSRFYTDTSDDYEFIQGFLMDKMTGGSNDY